MKKLIYNKKECTLCKGSKELKVSPNDNVLFIGGYYMICPFCNGKGHLKILVIENKDSLKWGNYKRF